MYGTAAAPAAASAAAPLPLLFYPLDRMGSRLSGSVAPRAWRIEVSAPNGPTVLGVSRGYWPIILSVLLMGVTLGLTVRAHGAEKLLVPVFRRVLGRNLERDLHRLAELVQAGRPARAA